MFDKTRRKIVATVMLSLVFLLAATLCTIYLSSYYEMKKQNTDMLTHYVSIYSLDMDYGRKDMEDKPPMENGIPGNGAEPVNSDTPNDSDTFINGDTPMNDEHMFRHDEPYKLSTFYSVAFSENSEVLRVDNGRNDYKSEEELVSIARDILEKGKTSGTSDNLMFTVEKRDDYTLVAFIDNTITDNNMKTLLRQILILGGVSIVVLFFLSMMIAKRIVKPLEENDRRQKQFVSDAGHELKTPVSVISANCELLLRQTGENEWLSNIQYENERMGLLIKQLLDLSHAENAELLMEKTDFSRLVTGGELPFESVAFEKGLSINCDIEDNIYVLGNATQLSQLAAILLDNAIAHSTGSDEIVLSLKTEHHSAVLTVINSAGEIPKDKLEHLFERFYRVDEARNGDGRHYGLGLSIAKAITETHKGNISVSCYDGKVVFRVELPLQK